MENFFGKDNIAPLNSWVNGKWFTDNSGLLFDYYARQLKTMANTIAGFYQMVDPIKSTHSMTDGSPFEWNNFMNGYIKLMNKSRTTFPFGPNVFEQMNNSYSVAMEQFTRFNQEVFNVFQNQLQKDEKDIHQYRQLVEKFINDQLQLSKQVMDALNTAFNNRISFQSEIGKKTIAAIMKQQEMLNQQNKKIIEEWNSVIPATEKTEFAEKTIKKKKEELVPA